MSPKSFHELGRQSSPTRFSSPAAEHFSDLGYVSTACIRAADPSQTSDSPFGPHEHAIVMELTFGHLRSHLTDVPPQPNSAPDGVVRTGQLFGVMRACSIQNLP